MNTNTAFKDTRLLEVLDHIDENYLAEALEDMKFPRTTAAPASGKGKILRSLKYVAALAACLLLLGAVMPLVQYLSGNLGSFLPSGWFEYDPPYWEYTPELEPLSKEMVEEIEEAYLLHRLGMTPEEYIAQAPNDRKEAVQQMISNIHFFEEGWHFIYYGKFGDSVVAAKKGSLMEGVDIKVAGYSISYSSSPAIIYVYNNGVFYHIEEAYEMDLLTDDNIKTIAERHAKFGPEQKGNKDE